MWIFLSLKFATPYSLRSQGDYIKINKHIFCLLIFIFQHSHFSPQITCWVGEWAQVKPGSKDCFLKPIFCLYFSLVNCITPMVKPNSDAQPDWPILSFCSFCIFPLTFCVFCFLFVSLSNRTVMFNSCLDTLNQGVVKKCQPCKSGKVPSNFEFFPLCCGCA